MYTRNSYNTKEQDIQKEVIDIPIRYRELRLSLLLKGQYIGRSFIRSYIHHQLIRPPRSPATDFLSTTTTTDFSTQQTFRAQKNRAFHIQQQPTISQSQSYTTATCFNHSKEHIFLSNYFLHAPSSLVSGFLIFHDLQFVSLSVPYTIFLSDSFLVHTHHVSLGAVPFYRLR